MSGTAPALDAATERRIEESLERRQLPLSRRELLFVLPFALSFALAAIGLAVFGDPARPLSVPVLVAFIAAYLVAERIEFSTGAGYAVPTQLVLVPMLLLLPTPLVPLHRRRPHGRARIFAAASGRARSLLALGDAWFALVPAIVLVATGAQVPDLAYWPQYLAALAAQLVFNVVGFTARGWLGAVEMSLPALVREMRLAQRVDVLLAPIGLLAAVAAADAARSRSLLVLAARSALLRGFARERNAPHRPGARARPRLPRHRAAAAATCSRTTTSTPAHHTEDVVDLSVAVARAAESWTRTQVFEVGQVALLHDIGKVGVGDAVLNKPGRAERARVGGDARATRRSRALGSSRSSRERSPHLAPAIPRAEHERWDGGGYPDGLAGEDPASQRRITPSTTPTAP